MWSIYIKVVYLNIDVDMSYFIEIRRYILSYISISAVLLITMGDNYCYSQSRVVDSVIEAYIDGTPEALRSEAALDLITDRLLYIAENPILINRATKQQLLELPFITTREVDAILFYIGRYGGFYTEEEIKAIPEISSSKYDMLLPFIRIYSDKRAKKYSRNYGKHELMVKLEHRMPEAEGYKVGIDSIDSSTPKYIGSSQRYYMRLKGDISSRFRYGVVAEKDPGETAFSSTTTLFDYQSGFVSYSDGATVKDIIIGSFHLNRGQGLAFGTSSMSGKSSQVIPKIETSKGVKGYISTDENSYLQGVGAQFDIERLDLLVAISRKRRDANIIYAEDDTLNTPVSYSSLQSSGYHRTVGELEDKNSLRETVLILNGEYLFSSLKLGALYSYGEYSLPKSDYTSIDTTYTPKGDRYNNLSGYYQADLNGVALFGEVVLSQGRSIGFIQGVESQLADILEMALVARSYGRELFSPYGSGFAEGKVNNENGLYISAKVEPLPKVTLSLYYDYFIRPWKVERSGAWLNGYEMLSELSLDFSKKIDCYFRFKHEYKSVNGVDVEGVEGTLPQKRTQLRAHGEFNLSKRWRFITRFEEALYAKEEVRESGYLLYIDGRYKSRSNSLSISGRVAYFDTDSYQSRVYMYENDMLYQYSNPSLYSRGVRTYINCRYQPVKSISLYLKAGYRYQYDTDQIGSGDDITLGASRTELKFMLRFKI